MVETRANPWFLVFSKAGSEKKAERWLKQAGRETFLPMLHTVVVTQDKNTNVIKPLFPRYLFVQEDGTFDPINLGFTPGVSHVVRRSDQKLARLADEVIAEIKGCARNATLDVDPAFMSVGDEVEVTLGYGGINYPGIVGKLLELRPEDRALVLLTLFGSSRQVEVGLAQVSKLLEAGPEL